MSPLEIAAFVTGLIAVALTVRATPWCWPVSLVNAVLYALVFYESKLYAETTLQGVFFVLSVYGWWCWLAGRTDTSSTRPISRVKRPWFWGFVWGGLTVTWGGALHLYTDAAIPWIDAGLATASLIAQWLLARKVLENWWVWILVDVIYVPVFYSRGLVLTSALYLIFLGLAIAGALQWSRMYRDHGSR